MLGLAKSLVTERIPVGLFGGLGVGFAGYGNSTLFRNRALVAQEDRAAG